ncbi:MAG: transcription elongation factor subunit Spt4 [Zestosphaera sp.]
MSVTRGKKPLFKACMNCRYLVNKDATKCPNCGNDTFTEDWRGVILIIDPEKSSVSKHLNIKKEGKYALQLGI